MAKKHEVRAWPSREQKNRRGGLGLPRAFKARFDAAWRNAEKKAHGWVDGHATHIRSRLVRCGKNCGGCPHGAYFYEVWRGDDGRIHERYLGRMPGL